MPRSRKIEHAYPSADETAVWIALNLAQKSIYQAMDAALKANKLPPLRWYDVLWSIERAKSTGIRPVDLEKMLIFEQSRLSRMLRRMIDVGLITETRFKGDRRGKLLHITANGRATRKRMWAVYGPLIHDHTHDVCDRYDPAVIASALRLMVIADDP